MIEPILPDRLVEQHVSVIFRTCRRNTPCDESAWEAFQETFLVFSRRRADLDHQSDFGPWLHETARRCCLAVVRKERRLPATGVADLDSAAPVVDDDQANAACLAEVTNVLREELSRLPQEDQDLLRCLYAEGMTHRDIAGRLNCPAGSVHAKAEEARRRLRKRIERRGIVASALLLLFLLQGKAEAGWAPTASNTRTSPLRRKMEWRSLSMASLGILAIFIPVSLYWNVTMATDIIATDSHAAVSATAYSCNGATEFISERTSGDVSVDADADPDIQ